MIIQNEEKNSDFVSLVSDTTFKYLFKNPDTRKWLEEIVLEKTGIDLTSYEFVDNEDNTGSKVKDFRFDLVLKDLYNKNYEYVIIEMNASYSEAGENKGYQYAFRKASFGFDKGDDYKNPPKVKLVMFNNYKSKELNGKIDVASYELLCKKYNLKLENIEIHEIYLKLFHEMCYDECDKIDKRLWLFGAKSFDEMKTALNSDNKHIIEELERLSVNDKFRDEYDYENVQRKLLNSVKSEGFEQGVAQEKENIAKVMLTKGIDLKTISEITKLSIEEVEKLNLV